MSNNKNKVINAKTQEVLSKVDEAIESGKYFITISTYDSDKKEKIIHFYATEDFQKGDLIPSLRHLKEQVESKEVYGVGKRWD